MSSDIGVYMIDGYLPSIGIECHVQLRTATKLFGTESNDARGANPNTLIGHVSYGLPGALPVLNREAVRLSAKAAYALGTTPQRFSKFDRKHYFYPDLPKGYQITQFEDPIILGGSLKIYLSNDEEKTISITRAHMEEDAGKSTHPTGADFSLVDLNRAGTPLLEIVSEPDMHSSEDAKAFAKELWLRMKYADVSDVDLYHGNMRFDVNVSVSKDSKKLGTRSETKNLNSFKSVERAVEYEIRRQIDLLEKGEKIVQETRGWLDDKQKTVSQRSKEDAHDYRYFPDPDIPPIVLDDAYLKELEKEIPTMPDEWRKKLDILGIEKGLREELLEAQAETPISFLEMIVNSDTKQAKMFANWIINIEVPLIRENENHMISLEVRKSAYAGVYALIDAGKLSSNNAKALLEELLLREETTKNIEELAEQKGMVQMSDNSLIEKVVDTVISANPKPVDDVKNGEMKAIGFLVGQVMKESKGKANPAQVQKILKDKLGV